MTKVISFLFAIAFLWWLGYIFIASNPNVRIERTCDPISTIFGRVTGSVADLWQRDESDNVREWFEEFTYSCRYVVWNQFYGEEYRARARRAPVEHTSAERTATPAARLGIDGKPLPELPGQPNAIARTPLPGEIPQIEPLPAGVVPPPLKADPAPKDLRAVAPPPPSAKRRASDSEDWESIPLPEKLPYGVPSPKQ